MVPQDSTSSADESEKGNRAPASSRNVKSGNIQVTIQTRDGLHIRKSNLDYQGLRHLVERLEFKDGVTVYKIEWKSLVAVLESPVVTSLQLQ